MPLATPSVSIDDAHGIGYAQVIQAALAGVPEAAQEAALARLVHALCPEHQRGLRDWVEARQRRRLMAVKLGEPAGPAPQTEQSPAPLSALRTERSSISSRHFGDHGQAAAWAARRAAADAAAALAEHYGFDSPLA